jgi:hypothetical protein
MVRALDLVAHDRREARVQGPASQRVKRLVRGRGSSGWENRSRLPSTPNTRHARAGARLASPATAATSAGVGCESAAAVATASRLAGQRLDSAGDRLEEALGNRRGGSSGDLGAVSVERRGELEREKRIAPRDGAQAPERRSGKDQSEAALQNPMNGFHAEWPDLNPLHVLRAAQPRRLSLTRPVREQQTNALEAQSPPGEGENSSRRGVQPLHVVDRDEHGALDGERPQRGQDRHRDDALLDRRPARALEQERNPQRVRLWHRKLIDDLARDVLEQIPEPREPERRIRGGRTRQQHAMPAPPRRLGRGLPEDRLAHARLTHEQRRGRPIGEPVHERRQRSLLVFPADHL